MRVVTLADGSEISCRALVIATGVSVREMDAPGVKPLTGVGIYYGTAATEAANYRGQPVYVVGGANSAGQGAVFLARYASKVTMLVRGDAIEQSMSQYLVDQIKSSSSIEVVLQAEVVEAKGNDRLEAITIKDITTQQLRTVPCAAMFIFIGAAPRTELVADLVERNPQGFIITGPDLIKDGKRLKGWPLDRDPFLLETSVPGIFAAGDVRDGVVRRVASAVGEGAIAVSFVHRYLATV